MDILIRKKSKEPILPLEYERDEQVAMLVGKIMKICHFNMVNPVLFSSATEEWYTPQDFFDAWISLFWRSCLEVVLKYCKPRIYL